MKNGILTGAVRLFSTINTVLANAAGTGEKALGETDFAVLRVAMMVAALDGELRDDELAAFERLAKKCAGYTKESGDRALKAGLRSAGYLQLQSRQLRQSDLVAEFVAEATTVLPEGFALMRAETVRAALVTWIAMSLSDGDYSPVERKAIAALVAEFAKVIDKKCASDAKAFSVLSPARAVAMADEHGFHAERQKPSEAFLKEAESLLVQMRDEDRAAQAAKELKALVLKG